ncbi:thioredoxin domain-containing protein [Cryomorphaceae bacterium 1068]|nr:thioredoxin domain-containing protein [Cryomorphaceae bacterium 1068]
MSSPKHTNALAEEDSLYLLQHAHNPVNWMPWGEEARQKATEENKLVLVSIGYSSCHWCHVMEHESFEDEAVAEVMNRHFVCVKVDREERPDIDQIYMEAVQMMTGQGGWPLNCFTNPEGKPVYGGTYFPKEQWVQVLKQLATLWNDNPEKVNEYGEKLTQGMKVSGILPPTDPNADWPLAALSETIENWKTRFDTERGGPNKAPKFPLPSNYSFLLKYGYIQADDEILEHVKLTLDEMGRGGIYDQIGGGFTRYSTDSEWKVPHFEKMLYDNAQLLTLYSEAYAAFGDLEYLYTVNGIKAWLRREMQNGKGGYFSAIDADSEGIEGKFYVWDKPILEQKYPDFGKYYYLDQNALWEGMIIPVRKGTISDLSKNMGIPEEEVISELAAINEKLLAERSKRMRPGTDDKSLCSWNAMLITGFANSYIHTGEESDLAEAKSILGFIESELVDQATLDLKHTWKNGKAKINGFLEDYAFLIEAYLSLYEATFAEAYLERAKELSFKTLDLFYDERTGVFFFTPHHQTDLVSRPMELNDNVIPSSNSVMAVNFIKLSSYFRLPHFEAVAKRLLNAVEKGMKEYGSGYSNWAELWLRLSIGSPELVAAGNKATTEIRKLKVYAPLVVKAAAEEKSQLELLKGRLDSTDLQFYLCQNRACKRPVNSLAEAEGEIKKIFEKN